MPYIAFKVTRSGIRIAKFLGGKQLRLPRKEKQMEKQIELNAIYTPEEVRTSSNNMMCVVTYEPLPKDIQKEIEELLATVS